MFFNTIKGFLCYSCSTCLKVSQEDLKDCPVGSKFCETLVFEDSTYGFLTFNHNILFQLNNIA
ncbi:hypothetical protein BpHYR1_016042 [Brachionus plicatilis]|uniref:Uncharacterized protein n=1 Tax=Brachionus plicatilis TaxID=10195 RepID=A0A3M7R3S0_BRAPC|nr:hypothetical protein BpHYR1_016042 [Brachionus plicatilis]